MTRGRCQKCGKLLIPAMGNPAASLLLVGEFPGHHETIEGVPFAMRKRPTDYLRAGDILRDELNRFGVSLHVCYMTNLWQHARDEKECSLDLHLDQLTKLFTDRTHVLLMGSEVTMALLGQKVGTISGLRVKVPGFKQVRFWASPNPALAFKSPLGELRLAFSRFAEDVSKKK
jgi:uracil-DNA glycosylase family 4